MYFVIYFDPVTFLSSLISEFPATLLSTRYSIVHICTLLYPYEDILSRLAYLQVAYYTYAQRLLLSLHSPKHMTISMYTSEHVGVCLLEELYTSDEMLRLIKDVQMIR
jgi:hypothetical protein